MKRACPSRRFLRRLDEILYIDISQQAHLTSLGMMKRTGHLLASRDLDSDSRRLLLRGYMSEQAFIAITMMLMITSILDERFGLGLEPRIRELWTMLGGHSDTARLLQEVRYEAPLFG